MMDWTGLPVLVTGGASFIGSHLVDALVARGAEVSVVDNLSAGRLEHLQDHVDAGRVQFVEADLLEPGVADGAVAGARVVFHLAADHGGRGCVDLHQAAGATNLTLDGLVFLACRKAGVDKVVYASSACVYPDHRQQDPDEVLYLHEEMAGPPYDAADMYGWAKLMSELTLRAYAHDWGMRTASCRYFTVYGERAGEDLAVMAMIARAFTRQDPFEVWGDGRQVRGWTYVSDVVDGTIRAAELIDDGAAVNLGTMERTRVIDAAHQVLGALGHDPEVRLRADMPTGPLNRVADSRLACRLLGWEPRVPFAEGLRRTLDWYCSTKDPDAVRRDLARALVER